MKKLVLKALKPLVGLPLRHVARSSNMLALQFGEIREVLGHSAPDWTIQIQCPWRILQGTHIVIAYRDFYYSDAPLKSVDVVSRSRTNSVLETLCREFELTPPRVQSVEAEDTGNFSLRLGSDYCVEVLAAESMEPGKQWRIHEPGAEGRSFVFPPSEE